MIIVKTNNLFIDSSLCFITQRYDCFNRPITTVVTTEYTNSYPMSCKHLLHLVLLVRGSTLKSSIQTSKIILRKKKLVPFLIDYQKKLFLLPIYPLRSEKNIYINPFNIIQVKPINKNESMIIFQKGVSLVIPLSAKTILKKQIYAQQLLNNIDYYLNSPLDSDGFKPFL